MRPSDPDTEARARLITDLEQSRYDALDPRLIAALERIQERVLWLAVRMVDHANSERVNTSGMKVGGHQSSSASMVSLMTALWFYHLTGDDRVSVKPHASPVFHAVQYLLGNLDRSALTTLRQFGGLQAYASRTKDPDGVDYSTGSVGLGAVAPLFSALVRRYVDCHFSDTGSGRFVALVGDAEVDEGNIWEAVMDPLVQGLGNVLWVVDLNRQSLDRVIPGIKARRLQGMFRENGWHVLEAKYGRALAALFAQPDGWAVRRHIDEMSNERYQSLFAISGAQLRAQFCAGADAMVNRALADTPDHELARVLQNLGGHDIAVLLECLARTDAVTDRPSVLFAYTVKGWGLPAAGDPLNHSVLLTPAQIDELRRRTGLEPEREWDAFAPDSEEGRVCAVAAARMRRQPPSTPTAATLVPPSTHPRVDRKRSTQEAFGRIVAALGRDRDVAARMVTVSPDVALSTNLVSCSNSWLGFCVGQDLVG